MLVFAGQGLTAPIAGAGTSTYLPNAMVKAGAPSGLASDYVGYDVYNADSTSPPTATVTGHPGRKLKWSFRYQNDGTSVDDLHVQACQSTLKQKRYWIRYFMPDLLNIGQWDDVTSELVAGAVFSGVSPGGGLSIKAVRKVPKWATGRTFGTCLFGVRSESDTSEDHVRVRFKIR